MQVVIKGSTKRLSLENKDQFVPLFWDKYLFLVCLAKAPGSPIFEVTKPQLRPSVALAY